MMSGDVLVVSPHCDDAVFSCGDFLVAHPRASVVTIFAGRPQSRYHVPRDKSRTSLRVHPQRAIATPLVGRLHVALHGGFSIAVLRNRDRVRGA